MVTVMIAIAIMGPSSSSVEGNSLERKLSLSSETWRGPLLSSTHLTCCWPQCVCVFVYVSSSVTSALEGELGVRWGRDKPQAISLDMNSGAGFAWK